MFNLTSTMREALHYFNQKQKIMAPHKEDGELIAKIANAMMDKRAELIAEPLSRCWYRLAQTALDIIDEHKRI